ncbi:MAG: peptidylprolyl isomerase [Myxococcota bacterium]
MSELEIGDGKVASFHYTLRRTDDAGEVLDSSDGRTPLAYLHGAGNIVPGLERQLTGKKVGDKFQAVVEPDDGYGVRQGDAQPVDRKAFPEGMQLAPGMVLQAETQDHEVIPLWVVQVEDDKVWVDENHPLAGVTLHFSVEVVDIRDATETEVSHGHPHGPDGHDHH